VASKKRKRGWRRGKGPSAEVGDSIIQLLKEKLDYRLEEILATDKCDTVIHLVDDDREILTKCVGHAFGLHLHINFVIKERQDEGSLVVTVMTVEVGE